MSRTATRFGIIAMLLALGVTIVYVLSSAAGGPDETRPFEKFAKGPLSKLDFAYSGEQAPQADAPDPALQTTAPATSETAAIFTGPDDAPLSFEAFQGKVILVNFWATWCAPCEREMPSLGALQTALGGEDFQVVAISVDNEEDKTFARDQLATWSSNTLAFYHTPEFALTYEVGIRGFPTSIIYDASGREVTRLPGELDWSSIEAVGLIRAIIEKGA